MKQSSQTHSTTMSPSGSEICTNQLPSWSLSQVSELDSVSIGVDLVSAARRTLSFLRAVGDSQWLHQESTILEAVRRYEELWMPLVSDLTVGPKPPMVLPPIDVEWVWFCHTLNPESYRRYCELRFTKLIGKPTIFDNENEEYAITRCKKAWSERYPDESFENEVDSDSQDRLPGNEDLYREIIKWRSLTAKLSAPYMSENVYLIAARLRYKGFLLMLQKSGDECSCFVPAVDISLMWLTHQSYPTIYAEDLKDVWEDMRKVAGVGEAIDEIYLKKTKELWDKNFNQPYEKAGGEAIICSNGSTVFDPPIHWTVFDVDINAKYKSMSPRFILEVCLYLRLSTKAALTQVEPKPSFLRLRVSRCHRELKCDKPITEFTHDSWTKAYQGFFEFGTRGIILEHHCPGGRCFRRSKLQESLEFQWNDLLRSHALTLPGFLSKQVRVVASTTPPAQASYLLKCVPDRATDDSGAMISDVILRMNNYRPQEGRWLSRTCLDHASRECFVLRIRVGRGIWRRGAEIPSLVKREERITEILEGSWSYVAGSIGRAPVKVVGTATPKEPAEHWQAAWEFSSGEEFWIRRDSSASVSGLEYCLKGHTSAESQIRLVPGRKMQYRMKRTKQDQDEDDDEEESFVTVIRPTEDNPTGKATALMNWKLLAVEFSPEEDAVLILLMCISILRSVTEMRREDMGKLLVRRRLREAKLGDRDWGSVVIHPQLWPTCSSSPHVKPWYWNPSKVIAQQEAPTVSSYPVLNYSNVEGGDPLFKHLIIG